MTVKQLKACRWRRHRIDSIQERIARLDSAITSTASKPLSKAPSARSGGFDRIGEAVANLEALRGELLLQVLELERQLIDVEEWLMLLPTQQAIVMRLRYVDGLSWQHVAMKAGYTVGHCRNIHSSAIKKT